MPAPSAYKSQELVAHRGELTIYGQFFLPGNYAGTGSLPTLACAHGLGSNYLHTVSYAWDLAAHGFAVYCFDFCGGGYASRSSGNPINMSLATERDDVTCVLRMLAQRPEVDPSRLFLLGEGQGGFAATMALHDDPSLAQALVLLYPAFYLHDEARQTFPTPKNVPVSYRQRGMRVGRGFGQVAWETNPYTQMRGFAKDVLIIHGDEDAVCPIEYSQRATEVFPHAELVVIHGGKHVFREKALEKSVATVRAFLTAEAKSTRNDDPTGAAAAPADTAPAAAVASDAHAELQATPKPDALKEQASSSQTTKAASEASGPEGRAGKQQEDTPSTQRRAAPTAPNSASRKHTASQSAAHAEKANHADAAKAAGGTMQAASAVNDATTQTAAFQEATAHEASSLGEELEEPLRGAHFASPTHVNRPQDVRGRHSVHKTRLNSGGRHFRR